MIDEAVAHILEVGLIGSVCIVLMLAIIRLYKDHKTEREEWAKDHKKEREEWAIINSKSHDKFIQALENNTRTLESIRVNTENIKKG